MKVKATLTILFLCLMLAAYNAFSSFLAGNDTIVRQTQQAVLIVAGEITDNQSFLHSDMCVYTDETKIKEREGKERDIKDEN